MTNRIWFLFFVILLLSFSNGCYASDNKLLLQHKQLLIKMYRYFENLKYQPLRLQDMKKFYSPNAKLITNGKNVAQGYDGFYRHFIIMLAKTKNFYFIFPKNSMIAKNKNILVKYNILLQSKNKMALLHVVAKFTFQNNKILLWDETVSKNYYLN